jgi:hypothetical protein
MTIPFNQISLSGVIFSASIPLLVHWLVVEPCRVRVLVVQSELLSCSETDILKCLLQWAEVRCTEANQEVNKHFVVLFSIYARLVSCSSLRPNWQAVWRATVALEEQALSLRSSEHDVLACRNIYLSAAYSILKVRPSWYLQTLIQILQ